MKEAGVLPSNPVAEWHNLNNIANKPIEHTAENVECWTENDNSHQQQKREDYVELAETLYPDVNTG